MSQSSPDSLRRAREMASAIGNEVKRLGDWKGLGSALARGNVERMLAESYEAVRNDELLAAHERLLKFCEGLADANEKDGRPCSAATIRSAVRKAREDLAAATRGTR